MPFETPPDDRFRPEIRDGRAADVFDDRVGIAKQMSQERALLLEPGRPLRVVGHNDNGS